MMKVSPLKQLKPATFRVVPPLPMKMSYTPRSRVGSVSAVRRLPDGAEKQHVAAAECFLSVPAAMPEETEPAAPPPLKRMSYSMLPMAKKAKANVEPDFLTAPTPPLTPYSNIFPTVMEPGANAVATIDKGLRGFL